MHSGAGSNPWSRGTSGMRIEAIGASLVRDESRCLHGRFSPPSSMCCAPDVGGRWCRASSEPQRHSHAFSALAKEGFFVKLWQVGLAEYYELEGIAWTETAA